MVHKKKLISFPFQGARGPARLARLASGLPKSLASKARTNSKATWNDKGHSDWVAIEIYVPLR